ncbi:glycerate kinase [Herbiconiux sp. VKM Ac-2851]|uniref:glycerate kinase n=1 Tax=Herbiconiux sp. VKM Ac-2851 TaxID=2739025 RepID=UPI0020B11AB0|nr:glycerate kinase [Herbiconiux sp. VKM Ac-2851]
MRVVIAPDSFKGSASAVAVASALAAGWRSVRPADELVLRPMADGGEGTLDALAVANPTAERMPVTVLGPADAPVAAHWLLVTASDGTRTGIVELAGTSGIELLTTLRPLDAHTRGFGEAIAAALDAGVDRLVLAIGGSASTDGGSGLLTALGARLTDAAGIPIPAGAHGLASLSRADLSALRPLSPGGAVVLTDVTSPLLGPAGAVAVFGPQKGLTPATSPAVEASLARYAALLAPAPAPLAPALSTSPTPAGAHSRQTVAVDAESRRSVAVDAESRQSVAVDAESRQSVAVDAESRQSATYWRDSAAGTHAGAADVPGSGAAGGAGFGLLVWGATLEPGAAAVARELGLSDAIAGADVVITGEGRFDGQSEAGKVPTHVRDLAAAAGARPALVAGLIEAEPAGFAASAALVNPELAGSAAVSLADPLRWLTEAGARLAQTLAP